MDYHEIDGNRWDKKRYTLEEAEALAKTMVDCSDCFNCSDCKNIPAGARYACLIGVYKYVCAPRVHADGSQWIQMGCFLRTRAEWETDPHNNPKEFSAGSPELTRRDLALQIAYQWLDANKPEGGEL